MEFTGERFHPELQREIWYEHYHRYVFAEGLAAGRRVLDLACGEGYGSELLARRARRVIGADRSRESVEHAARRYRRPGLAFVQADAAALPLASASQDLVVSFETLEHLEAQEAMLDEFARVLTPDGLLLISSPDRRTYSEERGFENEYHVRELYREEFQALLEARFPAVRLLGQKLAFLSLIWDPSAAQGEPARRAECSREGGETGDWTLEPMYWVAICARRARALPELPALHAFVDREESVYAHYYHEIRAHMAAGGIIAERDAEIARLRARLEEPPRSWWRRLIGR